MGIKVRVSVSIKVRVSVGIELRVSVRDWSGVGICAIAGVKVSNSKTPTLNVNPMK